MQFFSRSHIASPFFTIPATLLGRIKVLNFGFDLSFGFCNLSLLAPLVRSTLRLLVSMRFQVLFHSPFRGSFHLSLTVLVHYRSPNVFSLATWSSQIPTRFHVSRGTQVYTIVRCVFVDGTVALFGRPFQDRLTNTPQSNHIKVRRTLQPSWRYASNSKFKIQISKWW